MCHSIPALNPTAALGPVKNVKFYIKGGKPMPDGFGFFGPQLAFALFLILILLLFADK
ncbi:hypothetical protein KKC1_00180 [Calderihabitans maritimus]|uniref:Uncharacterized protein n=1 Tax=Calderihabitans maritimus TaxID=1246530 RepID=A0A1Z5HMV0_9FIRM|nr:hypothetical protein KKC1_00180 [Calderihabitans maritimus]